LFLGRWAFDPRPVEVQIAPSPSKLLPKVPQENYNFPVFNWKGARSVGTENNGVRNFKDLRGMTRNAKSLKKNDEACRGILIAPSKLPRFSSSIEIPTA
jgi:hypothetical protein